MEYKLQRSKRKTLTISISCGAVTVKAPQNMSLEHIESFIAKKSDWIEKKLAEFGRKSTALADVLSLSCVLYHGTACTIVRTPDRARLKFSEGVVYSPTAFDEKALSRAIAANFKRLAKTELAEKLDIISKATGLTYSSFALTNAKTKWGSCDGNGNIMLNWRLVMLNDRLISYVIVHELAHTLHHDHSAAFWAEVKRLMPDYAAAKKQLKEFSILTTMYR